MAFAVAIVRFCRTLPRTIEGDVFRKQLLRAGTGVGANYRASSRSRSTQEWRSRLAVVIEEADESDYWLTLMDVTEIGERPVRQELLREARELTALFSASLRTSRETCEL
jgi:four helix bundle protein